MVQIKSGTGYCEIDGVSYPKGSSKLFISGPRITITSEGTNSSFRFSDLRGEQDETFESALEAKEYLQARLFKAGGGDGSGSQVTIGPNGNWFIDGVDSGVKAEGESPYIGENGNWFIGDEDTGIQAQTNFDSDHFEIAEKEGQDVIQPKASGLVTKLESLVGEERLDYTAIKGMQAFIQQIIDANANPDFDVEIIEFATNSYNISTSPAVGQHTITFTGDTQEGDLILMITQSPSDPSSVTLNTPIGWTDVTQQGRLKVMARFKQSVDSNSYLFEKEPDGTEDENTCIGLSIRGASSISDIVIGTLNDTPGSGQTPSTALSLDSSEYLALAIGASTGDSESFHNWTVADFIRVRRQEELNVPPGYNGVISLASKLLPTGGNSGTPELESYTGDNITLMIAVKKLEL